MAADTLSKQGMNLTLNVFDTRNSMFRLKEIMPQIMQTNFDMVVGPLYDKNVEYVADQLADEKVPVISPLSTTVEVSGRPNLIQCITGKQGRIEKIADLLNNEFGESNVVFAHTNKAEEREEVQQIKARLRARASGSFIRNISFFTEDMLNRNDLKDIMDTTRYNVVVVVSEDKIFLSDLVNKLRVIRDTSIVLIGSSRLLRIPTLEISYLDYLNLTMPDMSYVDYTDESTIQFIEAYRKKYADEPGRFAFQGYDVGMYFLRKLWKSGVFFMQSLEHDKKEMLGVGFDVNKTEDGGYNNNFLFITGVRDMTLVKLESHQEDKSPKSPKSPPRK